MNKLKEWWDKFLDWVIPEDTHKQFDKSKLEYRDGDNT